MERLRVAVLASGRGTDLGSVLEACASGLVRAEVVAVASDRPDAAALDVARSAGVATHALPVARGPEGPAAQERALDAVLREAGAGLVVLAGYMRILSAPFVRAWDGRLVNIHPSLLPAFPGRDGVADALAHGARLTGCTTHFVDEQVDHGPLILQAAVPVRDGDDRASLAARILAAEHRLLPRTVDLVQQGRLRREGRRVVIAPGDSWRERRPMPPGVLVSEGY